MFVVGLSTPSYHPKHNAVQFQEDKDEAKLVQDQLGYLPSNFLAVSAWTSVTRQPIAIRTYPLQGGSKRRQAKAAMIEQQSSTVQSPFPTLYWLTNPLMSECLGNLERVGFIQDINSRLYADPSLVERLWRCHRQYAEERWETLSEDDQTYLLQASEPTLVSMRGIMRDSGISGSNLTLTNEGLIFPAIKCLHAHYAHYRSTKDIHGNEVNPVGEMIHEQLKRTSPDLEI